MSSFTQDFVCPKCGDQGLRWVWVNTSMRMLKYTEECTSPTCDYRAWEDWQKVDETPEGYDESVYVESLGPPYEPSDM